MNQTQGLSTTLKTSLEQTIAPQLLKSLSLLAMPVMELETQLNTELNENPILEIDSSHEEEIKDNSIEDADSFIPVDDNSNEIRFDENRDDFSENIEKTFDDEYLPSNDSIGDFSSYDDDGKRQYFFDSLTNERSLQEELLEQLVYSDCPENIVPAAREIIGSTNDSGYMETPLADIAQICDISLDDAEKALKIVQSFDPPGIAARDIRECLLIQLDRKGMGKSKAAILVENYLDDIGRNRLPLVAANMHITLEELRDVLDEIRKLDPHPGLSHEVARSMYVEPDVTVLEDGDDYKIEMARNSMPRFLISKRYLEMLDDPLTPEDTKKYIREKVLSAKQLIHNLEQRKSTIERISELIVSAQYDFFRLGKSALKPMTMKEIAEKTGVNETTVSRAVSGKYMSTPRGLVRMRDFFSGGFTTGEGADVSSQSVREMIREMISNEDKRKPLSDSKLEAMLKKRGLEIARRTIAKYREEMNISSSQLRKVY